MATGWIRAIRAVPWSDVIAAAPVVVGSAKKMFSALQKKRQDERAAGGSEPAPPPPDDPELRILYQRTAALEGDLVAATEVLRNLADQHAQIVVALEALRQKTRLLAWTSALLAATLICLVLWIALR